MLAGDLYHPDDPEIQRDNVRALKLCEQYNRTWSDEPNEHRRILGELLGSLGAKVVIRDLPANVVAVGNPARIVRTIEG